MRKFHRQAGRGFHAVPLHKLSRICNASYMEMARCGSCLTRHAPLLDYEIEGKVGDIAEPFALSHGLQHFCGIGETKIPDGIL